mmetsp:Transcript_34446/g.81639  ORF Transcript_34446/g.81639 Transcript_34446/m.81639 type:complete len:125 (+) Transcript_34446:381-755(+)
MGRQNGSPKLAEAGREGDTGGHSGTSSGKQAIQAQGGEGLGEKRFFAGRCGGPHAGRAYLSAGTSSSVCVLGRGHIGAESSSRSRGGPSTRVLSREQAAGLGRLTGQLTEQPSLSLRTQRTKCK